MSNESKFKTEQATKIINTIVGLKESNPKAFYGGIAVLLLLFVFNFVGSGAEDSKTMSTNLVKGDTYTLKSPNGGRVLLMGMPTFGSAGSGEKTNVCTVKAGTKATLEEWTVVNFIHYVKVKPQGEQCDGKSGWTSKIHMSN
ncbi:MAG: hypothetical protein VX679_08325 [Pseudomonadota bacterium]|nr:hypothetical protein [Pseudomonadota bacterium]